MWSADSWSTISTDLWHVQVPLTEKVVRTVLVYGGLAVLLRLGGKRDLAQLNTFDLVVMLLLSNVVQNAVIGADDSVSGGLLGAAVLIAVNSATVRTMNRHPLLTRIFEGDPVVLAEKGRLLRKTLRRLGLREADVATALRQQGAADVHEVEQAVLAAGGSIVVTLTEPAQDATKGDLRREHGQLLADIRTEIDSALAGMEQRLDQRLGSLGR
jgi:uncharacterized membrane protein YcaP (DUF421 family)